MRRLLRWAGVNCAAVLLTVVNVSACTDDSGGSEGACPLSAPYCGGEFPLNTQDTTEYGPAWTNVITQFLPCYGPYALCYYADCTSITDTTVECPCESLFGLNFVESSSIMNLPVYEETLYFPMNLIRITGAQ